MPQPLTDEIRTAFGLPADLQGVLVDQLVPEGAAAKAGIPSGAVITTLGGKAVTSPAGLSQVLSQLDASEPVVVHYYVGGKPASKEVRLTPPPQAASNAETKETPAAAAGIDAQVKALQQRVSELEERLKKLEATKAAPPTATLP